MHPHQMVPGIHPEGLCGDGLVDLIGDVVRDGGNRMARTVAMTSMPQLVSLFNAVGGAAAALLALNDFIALDGHRLLAGGVPGLDGWRTLFIIADVIIGSVTFTGSLIASGKLMGRIKGQPILIPGGRILTWLLLVAGLSVSIVMILAGAGVVTYDSHVLTLLLLAALGYTLASRGPRSYRAEYQRRTAAALHESHPGTGAVVTETHLACHTPILARR